MDIVFVDIINIFLPETLLFGFIILNLLLSLFFGKILYKFSGRFALLGILIPLASIAFGVSHSGYTVFGGAYISTVFTMIMKVLILIGAFFTVILSQNITKRIRYRAFEYYTLILTATFGALCLVSSNDFIPMFVALETMTVSVCMLIGFHNRYQSKEAAIKYLLGSVISSGIMLFGISYLYGMCGELNYSLINNAYFGQDNSLFFVISCIFIICGLSFQTANIPFQFSLPDVFQGASYPVGAFISTIPVIAGFSALLRIITYIMYDSPVLQLFIGTMAILTVLYGVSGAIRQTNFKRAAGYSSVIQCGFMMLAVGIFSAYGITAFIFYITAYLFMTFGIWAAGLTFVACTESDEIKDYAGIFYVRPYYATSFIFCIIALAGFPPASGFLAKLFLFISVMRQDGSGLVFLIPALILAAAALYFYANLIKTMFQRKQCKNLAQKQMNTKIVLYFCTVMTGLIFIFADFISKLAIFASFGI